MRLPTLDSDIPDQVVDIPDLFVNQETDFPDILAKAHKASDNEIAASRRGSKHTMYVLYIRFGVSYLFKFNQVCQCLSFMHSDNLDDLHNTFVSALLNRLLAHEGLKLGKWFGKILEIVEEVVTSVDPNYRGNGDDMDIRTYVKIKKVLGGEVSECGVLTGEVLVSVDHIFWAPFESQL